MPPHLPMTGRRLLPLLLLSLLLLVSVSEAFWKFGKNKDKQKKKEQLTAAAGSPLTTSLDQEMAETEELIYLQREKLRLLELYRKTGGARTAAAKGPSTSATTAEEDQCLSSISPSSSISSSSSSLSANTYTHPSPAAVGGAGTMAEDYLVQMGVVTQEGNENEEEEASGKKTNTHDHMDSSITTTAVQLLTFQRVRDKLAPRGSPLHSSKTMSVLAVARERKKRSKGKDKASTSIPTSSLVSFYDMQGQLMGVYDPGHTTAVSTLAFEGGGSSDEALLLTGAHDGSLHLHNLTLWKDGNMVAGRQPLPLPSFVMPPVVTTEEGYGIQAYREIVLEKDTQTQTQTETDGESSSSSILSAMFYQHRRLGWTLVSGDAQGSIKFHLRNGTLVKAHDTGGHPVYALDRNGKALVYTADRDVRFLNSVTIEPMPLFYCLGRHGPLRSLSFDSLHPNLLHVGTEQGEILVFDTSPPSSRGGGQQQPRPQPLNKLQPHYHQRLVHVDQDGGHCAFIKKLASRSGPAPIYLATLRGYLLAASPQGHLFAYNTTGLKDAFSPLPLVFHLPFSPPSSLSSSFFFSASLAKISSTKAPAAFLRAVPAHFVLYMHDRAAAANSNNNNNHLVLFEALLPYLRPKPMDFMWIRLPLMLMALGLVFAWHFIRQKQQGLGGGGGNPYARRRTEGGAFGALGGLGAGLSGNSSRGRFQGHDHGGGGMLGMASDPRVRDIGIRPPGRRMSDMAEHVEFDEYDDDDDIDQRGWGPSGARRRSNSPQQQQQQQYQQYQILQQVREVEEDDDDEEEEHDDQEVEEFDDDWRNGGQGNQGVRQLLQRQQQRSGGRQYAF